MDRDVSRYRPDVDGLRAVAILGVLGYHAGVSLLPGGFTGVDVFFVISGYLISGIIFRALKRGNFSLLQFYARRIKRIFPALVLMLVVVSVCGWPLLLWDEYEQLGKHILGGAGFALNLVLYNDFNAYFGAAKTPLIHLWSLGVEEQFYIFWPLFLLCTWRAHRWQMSLVLLVIVASFASNVISVAVDSSASFYLPMNRIWELATGALLVFKELSSTDAIDTGKTEGTAFFPGLRVNLGSDARATMGAILIGASFLGIRDNWAFPGWWALVPCTGATLLISAGSRSWFNRVVLSSSAMVSIGLISYPLYLWHWPLLAILRLWRGNHPGTLETLAAVVLATFLATTTYKYVEIPVRSYRYPRVPVVGLCVAMSLCALVGLFIFVGEIPPRSVAYALDPYIRASRQDWLTGAESSWTWYVDGAVLLGNGQRKVVFIGDSNMQQYYPRIAKLLADHPSNSRSARFFVRAGCAPGVDYFVASLENSFAAASCRSYLSMAFEYAKTAEVETVVIAALWRSYTTDDWTAIASRPLKPDTDVALQELKQTVSDLIAHHKKVYIVLNIPFGANFDPRQMIRRSLFSPAFTLDIRPPSRRDMLEAVGPIGEKLRAIARESGASVIDPVEWLCTKTDCPATTAAGEPMYRDRSHLKPSYVRTNVWFLDGTVLDRSALFAEEARCKAERRRSKGTDSARVVQPCTTEDILPSTNME